MAIVDRTYEHAEPDNEIKVILDDGFEVEFFIKGLTDEEYIRRTKDIQKLESI